MGIFAYNGALDKKALKAIIDDNKYKVNPNELNTPDMIRAAEEAEEDALK